MQALSWPPGETPASLLQMGEGELSSRSAAGELVSSDRLAIWVRGFLVRRLCGFC